jgi:hypothetical protein
MAVAAAEKYHFQIQGLTMSITAKLIVYISNFPLKLKCVFARCHKTPVISNGTRRAKSDSESDSNGAIRMIYCILISHIINLVDPEIYFFLVFHFAVLLRRGKTFFLYSLILVLANKLFYV